MGPSIFETSSGSWLWLAGFLFFYGPLWYEIVVVMYQTVAAVLFEVVDGLIAQLEAQTIKLKDAKLKVWSIQHHVAAFMSVQGWGFYVHAGMAINAVYMGLSLHESKCGASKIFATVRCLVTMLVDFSESDIGSVLLISLLLIPLFFTCLMAYPLVCINERLSKLKRAANDMRAHEAYPKCRAAQVIEFASFTTDSDVQMRTWTGGVRSLIGKWFSSSVWCSKCCRLP